MRSHLTILLLAASGAVSAQAPAPDRAEIDRTQIIGNQELPKVLYIVPWKKPIPGALAARPRLSVLDEPLAPIERDEFRRQLHYSQSRPPQSSKDVQP